MSIRYLSLFSGIEAASVAWRPLGWEAVAFSEVEPFPCAVLKHHYPDVPNLGDITKITEAQINNLGHIDLVVFGFPCQDVSVAGKRDGLKGNRSGLFFTAMRIVRWSRARYALLENVPGLFSSAEGRDFAAVVGEMVGLEPDVPVDGWRNSGAFLGPEGLLEVAVMDAKFFGVPQRRRRIFALRDIGDWTSRPPILLEREGVLRDTPQSQEAGKDVAPTISARTKGGGGLGTDFDLDGGLICPTLRAGGNRTGGDRPPGTDVDTCESLIVTHTLSAEGFDASEDGTGRGIPLVTAAYNNTGQGWWSENAVAQTIRSGNQKGGGEARNGSLVIQPIPILEAGARTGKSTTDPRAGIGIGEPGDPMYTLQSGKQHAIAFSCKDNGADASEVAPTLRSMNFDKSHANAGGQVAIAWSLGSHSGAADAEVSNKSHASGGPAGMGISEDLSHSLKAGRTQAVAFNLRGREDGAQAEVSDVASLRSASGGSSRSYVAVNSTYSDVMQGFRAIIEAYVAAEKAGSAEVLSILRKASESKAESEWLARRLDQFWQAQVLQFDMHGYGVQGALQSCCASGAGPLPRTNNNAQDSMREMWVGEEPGCGSYRRESAEQLAGQSSGSLPLLPSKEAQSEGCLHDLWETDEGSRILQQAFDSLAQTWRSEYADVATTENLQGVQSASRRPWPLWQALHAGEAPRNSTIAAPTAKSGGQGSAVRRLTPL